MTAQALPRHAEASTAMTSQAPRHVVLVRPHRFSPNPATAADNAFQRRPRDLASVVARRAHDEVTELAEALSTAGVGVTLFEDRSDLTPDSVFPNNWFSTHADGTIALYPMYAENRRAERRDDVVEHLRERFQVRRVLDYSAAEDEGAFLEGTGAMVLDHEARVAYGCRSHRLSAAVMQRACADLGYEPLLFDATDRDGVPIYHTNVLMAVGTRTAVLGSSLIRDPLERARVLDRLRTSGRDVVELEEAQIRAFAGNCIELGGSDGGVLAMSRTARDALRPDQVRALSRSVRLLAVPVPTVESAGGSVRCMIAGNHLEPRTALSVLAPGDAAA